jgi:hypothetical protein
MSLRRTNVYADSDDLALIKEIANRRGVPEAQIIREGIHLARVSSGISRGQRAQQELRSRGRDRPVY